MSEVVPLPSFGEVFFDSRGQDRVLRVTWHDGTLVLSLWRGEMCTASFRMPLEDVGRLIDTLDDGYAEAGGDELVQSGQHAVQPTHDYPGTGRYAYPDQPTDVGYADQGYSEGYPDQTAYPDQGGGYADPAYPDQAGYSDPVGGYPDPVQSGGYPEPVRGGGYASSGDYQGGYAEPDPTPPPVPPAPNDVLVARGTPGDRRVAGPPPEPVPRENIIGDVSPYTSDPAYPPPPSDPYGPPPHAQGGGPPTDPYGFSAHDVPGPDPRYGMPRADYGDSYGPPLHDQSRTYGRQVPHPDPYGTGYGEDTGHPKVDPADPLGLGPQPTEDYYPSDPRASRSYHGETRYPSGEHPRPDESRDDRAHRSDW